MATRVTCPIVTLDLPLCFSLESECSLTMLCATWSGECKLLTHCGLTMPFDVEIGQHLIDHVMAWGLLGTKSSPELMLTFTRYTFKNTYHICTQGIAVPCSVSVWQSVCTSVCPTLITTLQRTIFSRSCSYLSHPVLG